VAPRSEDPKLIIRVFTSELIQLICSRYINVTEGEKDGRLAKTAQLRGKNAVSLLHNDNVYGAIIVAQPLREFTRFI